MSRKIKRMRSAYKISSPRPFRTFKKLLPTVHNCIRVAQTSLCRSWRCALSILGNSGGDGCLRMPRSKAHYRKPIALNACQCQVDKGPLSGPIRTASGAFRSYGSGDVFRRRETSSLPRSLAVSANNAQVGSSPATHPTPKAETPSGLVHESPAPPLRARLSTCGRSFGNGCSRGLLHRPATQRACCDDLCSVCSHFCAFGLGVSILPPQPGSPAPGDFTLS